MSSLASFVDGWTPAPTIEEDHLDETRARWLADILDAQHLPRGGVLPVTWQWGYFTSWPASAALNADGHPCDGPFQPPIPDRRRMWAGGSMSVRRPLRLDAPVQRHGSVQSVAPKSGRSGEMVLVGVQYDYRQDGELCHREIQNHVYRSGLDGAARDWPPRPIVLPESAASWRYDVRTDPIRLFRMSALTGNSHRIHYDLPYATRIEGFPDLVVHGPLLAQQLAILATRHASERELVEFDYRLQHPVFVGDAVSAIGVPEGDRADLSVISDGGRTHVSASATYRVN